MHPEQRRTPTSCVVRIVSCVAGLLTLLPAPARSEPPPTSAAEVNARVAGELVAVVRNPTMATPARVAAAKALGQMGGGARAAIPELIVILENRQRGYPFVLDEALVKAVALMGSPAREAIPALVQNAGRDCDLDRTINESVTQILRGVPASPPVAKLIEQLKSTASSDRLRAAKELAALGLDARDATASLVLTLNDPDPDVRRQAFRALVLIRPGAAPDRAMLSVLVRDMTDPNEAVRIAAVKGLVRAGPAARFAVPVLQAAARNDPDEDVRRLAADAIGRLQGDNAPPVP